MFKADVKTQHQWCAPSDYSSSLLTLTLNSNSILQLLHMGSIMICNDIRNMAEKKCSYIYSSPGVLFFTIPLTAHSPVNGFHTIQQNHHKTPHKSFFSIHDILSVLQWSVSVQTHTVYSRKHTFPRPAIIGVFSVL